MTILPRTSRPGLLALALATILLAGCGGRETPAPPAPAAPAETQPEAKPEATAAMPHLLDLGAHSCIPCKMMAPILDELTKEYEGRMKVTFIDVWANPDEGKKYGIQTIPTQIFYGSDGQELFRHVGFLAKEDILAKWRELGYDFAATEKEE